MASAIADSDQRDRHLTSLLTFLFIVRWPAWLIAFLAVEYGQRPAVNVRYEPALLIVVFLHICVGVAYVYLIRPRLRAAVGSERFAPLDVLAIALDMTIVFSVHYLSGGFATPYYHYSVVSLLVPTFLVSRAGAAVVLAAYVTGFVAMMASAGHGTATWWPDQVGNTLPGLLITPALVVVVAQYLQHQASNLERRRLEARRALRETRALYDVARASASIEVAAELAHEVALTISQTGRFNHVSVWQADGGTFRCHGAFDGVGESATPRSPNAVALVALPGGSGAAQLHTPLGGVLETVPVNVRERQWGVIAFDSTGPERHDSDARLLGAVSGQLALGLAKIELNREREDLAALEERGRIAREIHDGIAQSIYMLSLNLEKAADLAGGSERLAARLTNLVGVAKEALIEVRHYIFDLKPMLAGEETLAATLRAQVREFRAVADLPVEFEVTGEERELPIAISGSLYRILQEALANAYRHAQASTVKVKLHFEPQHVTLDVTDDGLGFDVENGTSGSDRAGRGITNMRERSAELGGTMEVQSAPHQGTIIHVTLPTDAVLTGGQR